MLLTHLGASPGDGLGVGGRPGGFVGGLATSGDWPSRLTSWRQLGAVTWRGLTLHLHCHVRILFVMDTSTA